VRHPLKDCFIQHCKLHEMEQWGNACTAGDPYHNMGMHSCASTNHFYESSLLQTTRYVEFQGTGVGDGLRTGDGPLTGLYAARTTGVFGLCLCT